MAKVKKTFKVGQKATMLFHGAGVTSKEKHVVSKVTKDEIWLDCGDDHEWCFNRKTGHCRNDNTMFGFRRELEL
jgi:hypothetical protein